MKSINTEAIGIHSRRGFTIVELLIVIVVIGILAAITIVAFNGVQNSAYDAAVKSDVAGMGKKLETMRVESATDRYPSSLTASQGFSFSKGAYDTTSNNLYYCYNTETNKVALGFAGRASSYTYSTDGGVQSVNGRIYGSTTCSLLGTTWAAANTVSILGYSAGWSSWTN